MRLISTLFIVLSTTSFSQSSIATEEMESDVLPLDSVTISAEKRREMMARVLRIGMSNVRSDRAADANKIVCVIRNRTGSHIKDMLCGTNAAFNYQRDLNFTLNSGTIGILTTSGKVSLTDGQIVRQTSPSVSARSYGKLTSNIEATSIITLRGVSRGQIKSLINDYASDVSDVENRARLRRDMIWTNFAAADGRHGFSADQYTAFVQAYKEVKTLESSSFAFEASRESAMAAAIDKYGLSIDIYNEILGRVLQDDDLRARIMNGLDIEI